jgi:hypothetical protein
VVCAGQRVTTDTATRETAGNAVRYTNEELRAGVAWVLEEAKLYNLLLLCVPPGSALTAQVTVGPDTFEDQCTAGTTGSVGPWIIFVAPAAAAAGPGEAPGEGGPQ